MRLFLLISIVGLIITVACEKEQSEPKTDMLPLIYEKMLLASIDTASSDTNMLEATLDSLNISKSEFDMMLNRAQENPGIWIATLDSVLKALNAKTAQDTTN